MPSTCGVIGVPCVITVLPMTYAVALQTPEGYIKDLGDGSSSSSI